MTWIADQPFSKNSNFTVAVYGANDLIITKVGGITDKADAAQQIFAEIKSQSMHTGRRIFLAQSFTTDGSVSNHAEMCILAAVGAENITYIRCTAPNCKFCKETLQAYKVNNGNAGPLDGKSQVGWRHPFLRISFGTQLPGTPDQQLDELKEIHRTGEVPARPAYGQRSSGDPASGNFFEVTFD
ncbi:hypothetical protein [Streptosporangium sp. NPDC000396]|uniref:hypothetical protein n=1 Tax=Streptosporangium sp. NPDC000396 TaxID=3366185 RepID=UPI0036C9CC06